jgi:hypothetical protein
MPLFPTRRLTRGRMPNERATGSENSATKAEIVVVFVALSAIIGFSYFTAHHAAAHTLPDPAFRHLVRPESTKLLFKTEYLYVPLLFQIVAWLGVGASLLPVSIQESWLLMTHRLRRLPLYLAVAFCTLIWVGIYSHSSRALSAASAPVPIDQSSSTSSPDSPK